MSPLPEIFQYVYEKVPELTGFRQRPSGGAAPEAGFSNLEGRIKISTEMMKQCFLFVALFLLGSPAIAQLL